MNRYPPDHPAMWSRCPACQRLAHWGECAVLTDIQGRIGHDIGDVCDLIVRKAGEEQREEGLANAASQHRCSHPSDQAAARLGAPRFDQLSEDNRGPGLPKKQPGSNS